MKWDKKSGLIQPEDIEAIEKLVGMLPTDREVLVYDLGAGSGTTALSVFSARYEKLYVVSVDISQDALDATRANMVKYGFLDHWQYIHSRSDRAGRNAAISPDLLLCDSTHDYASQQDELYAWLPRMDKGSLIWIHEYAGYAHELYPTVKLAVDEFVEAGVLETLWVQGYSWSGRKI